MSGGSVALGIPVPIKEVAEVIEIVQSIHRGRCGRRGAGSQRGPAAHTHPQPRAVRAQRVPGRGSRGAHRFQLHSNPRGLNPPNIAAFARGIRDAVAPDVGVQLFACSTGHDTGRSEREEWTGHAEGERTGEGSFAAGLAEDLGPEASVYGLTTAGHTTENYAARVFGAAAGGAGGVHMFEVLYTEDFIQSELVPLWPDGTEEERAELHDPLREQMWAHYPDSISGERGRSRRSRRYHVPIGQEMFVSPANARALVQADFPRWVQHRVGSIRPRRPRRAPATTEG